MLFGQLVIGPPGSGKSTYCKHMAELFKKVGRKTAVINLDPGNPVCDDAAVDITELITVEDAMKHVNLGPNGGLIYCMEYLSSNFDWLSDKLKKLQDSYILIDCPGQVELYTHHTAVRSVVNRLCDSARLTAVHLVDSHACSDPGKFVACALTSLSAMLHTALPHINVLSKVDDMARYSELIPFGLDYYSEVLDLSVLVDALLDDPFTAKMHKLTSALASIIEDYSLVSFYPLNVKDQRMLLNIQKAVDRANGYCYGVNEERNVQSLLACAVSNTQEQDRIATDRDEYTFENLPSQI